MQISNTNANLVNKAYSSQQGNKTTREAAKAGKTTETQQAVDSVTLSSDTKDLQTIQKAMDSPSRERASRVNQLKNQVEQGEYTVNPDRVAGAMIHRMV
ncbi:MAG: flagellar biosynthesis anti-sigma factor FlgM [Desulfobacteraceae bacterium]